MTNKRLLGFIFIAMCAGIIGSVNVIYNHIRDVPYTFDNESYNVEQLNQKIKLAENQIKVIVAENNTLRKEIDGLKFKISDLAKLLKQYGVYADVDSSKQPNKA